MNLYMLNSYDDSYLRVCKNEEEVIKIFKETTGIEFHESDWNGYVEIKEVDGYEINLTKK